MNSKVFCVKNCKHLANLRRSQKILHVVKVFEITADLQYVSYRLQFVYRWSVTPCSPACILSRDIPETEIYLVSLSSAHNHFQCRQSRWRHQQYYTAPAFQPHTPRMRLLTSLFLLIWKQKFVKSENQLLDLKKIFASQDFTIQNVVDEQSGL